jgi:signal transduction histidine kinase
VRSLRLALIGLGLAGFMAGLVTLPLALASDFLGDEKAAHAIFGPLVTWSFVGTGLYAWWRRPGNNFGPLMTAIGFVWAVSALEASEVEGLYIIGLLIGPLVYALFLHMLVAFPAGRLQTRVERVLVGIAYVDTTVIQLIALLFHQTADADDFCSVECPANPLLISDQPGFADAVFGLQAVIGVFGLTAIAILLVRRWRVASSTQRRALAPVLLVGVGTLILLSLSLLGDVSGWPDAEAEDVIDYAGLCLMASVPFAFLAGLMRSRLSRAAAVSDLVSRLGEAGRRPGLRDALADGLGDPTLSLAYWVPAQGRYVDTLGEPVDLNGADERGLTHVDHDGERVAVIRHDPALAEEPELLQGVAAAAALALENERLNVELRARVDELRASRARIVQAADDERRRLERDLHDGAQQRLVSLALNLRLAGAKLDSDPAEARELLDETARELGEATTELRELARGLHPAVLSDRGLRPALEALAGRAPVPVELGEPPAERLPAAVESASYFVVAEALTNVARYSGASRAQVSVSRSDGQVEVEVSDDGVGGADPEAGSGLRGLADRVAALDGSLEVISPRGGGTTIRAVIPCA